MAIVTNFWLKGSKKRLAGAVLYNAMGQTRARELATSVSNPRTQAQMTQRIKWSNLVNFYRANASWMRYAYESKAANQSEYNKFMSLNVSNSRIALTKQAAASGAAVADAYILTQGSLPSIEWSGGDNYYVSNIYTEGLDGISLETRVSEFAAALINNNPAIQAGDQLSFIRISQMVNGSTGYPYIIVRKYEVILDPTSNDLLNDYIPREFLESENIGDEYTLNVVAEGRKGGFCMILSRTVGGRTYVSSQSLVIVNNDDVINTWASAAAVQDAIDSYGVSSDAFLSAATANTANLSPVGNSILSMIMDDRTYVPGQTLPVADAFSDSTVEFVFSQSLQDTAVVSNVVVTYLGGTTTSVPVGQVIDGNVEVRLPETPQAVGQSHIYQIAVTVDGTVYIIRFANTSDYSGGSLE